jgi:F-type H+-transporting ATPase subunit epsilon
MAATLKLQIVTPEAEIYSGEAEFVHLPGADGEMGVYPQHEALITELKAGELHIQRGGQTDTLAIGEGFAEITATSISVLTDGAVHETEIDEQVAEAAVKRAEELLKSTSLAGEELEATQAALARSLVQLNLKRRRRNI